MHNYFPVVLQEADNLTREKIQDELEELKEANAADEGAFLFFLFSIYWSRLPFEDNEINFWSACV